MEQTKKFYSALMILSLFCLWLGQKVGERQGLLAAFFVVFAFNTYIYYYSSRRIERALQPKRIEGHDPWGIIGSLNKYCQKAYTPVPEVYSCRLDSPTSLAFGRSPTQSCIVISDSLLKLLSEDELDTLIAMEVARTKKIDTLALAMFSCLMAFILGLAKWIDQLVFLQILRKKEKRAMPMTNLCLSLCRVAFTLCVPKKHYFETDKLAASLVGEPKKVAQLLWKIESYTSTQPSEVTLDMAHLYIVNPLPRRHWYSRLKYQPNFEQRIKKLIGYFPI